MAGDPMIDEIMEGDHVVVVEDARTDPRTNKTLSPSCKTAPSSMPLVLAGHSAGSMASVPMVT